VAESGDPRVGMIKVRCPNPACKKVLAVKAELGGKKGRCPLCGQIMSIPAPPAGGGSKTIVGLAPPSPAPGTPAEKPRSLDVAASPAPPSPPSTEPAAPSPPPAAAGPEGGVAGAPAAQTAEGAATSPPEAPAVAPPRQEAPSPEAPASKVQVGEPQPKGRPTPRTLARISGEVEETRCEIAGGRLTVSGPLGYELNREFRLKCEALMDSPEQALLIDLSKVPYLSSVHLGVIAPLFSRARESGKELALRADARVARVLRLAGFDKLGRIEIVGEE